MTSAYDVLIGSVATVIVFAVISLAYCLGEERVYQECKATGAYRVGFELKMKCEAVK